VKSKSTTRGEKAVAKHYDIPNTENLTDGGAVDVLCDWKEKEKEAKFYSGFYSDLIKARMAQTPDVAALKGERYIAEKKTFPTTRFDLEGLKEAAGKGDAEALSIMNRFYKTSEVTQLRTKELANSNSSGNGGTPSPRVLDTPPLGAGTRKAGTQWSSPEQLLKKQGAT
jgi:hypothetical protein